MKISVERMAELLNGRPTALFMTPELKEVATASHLEVILDPKKRHRAVPHSSFSLYAADQKVRQGIVIHYQHMKNISSSK